MSEFFEAIWHGEGVGDGGDLEDLNTPETLMSFSDDELDEIAAANNSYKKLDSKLLVEALTTVTAHVKYLQLHLMKMDELLHLNS